jgi:hypothetical protein
MSSLRKHSELQFKTKFQVSPDAPNYEVEYYKRQEYAQITKALGDARFLITDASGPEAGKVERVGHLLGRLSKRACEQKRTRKPGKHRSKAPKVQMLNIGDIVLFQLAGDCKQAVTIINTYTSDESNQLKRLEEISDAVTVRVDAEEDPEDTGFVFEDI